MIEMEAEVVGGGHTVAAAWVEEIHCAGKVSFVDEGKVAHIDGSLARPTNTLETQERRNRPCMKWTTYRRGTEIKWRFRWDGKGGGCGISEGGGDGREKEERSGEKVRKRERGADVTMRWGGTKEVDGGNVVN